MVAMAELILRHLNKTFDKGVEIIRNFDFEAADGEFIVIVGPSGCGKSTILRIISGLTDATAGEIIIGGRVVNEVEPRDRDIAMMFQDFTLYPSMTVRQNLVFGLKQRNFDEAEIEKRVTAAATTLGLTKILDRKPSTLSGGEKQRTALGRVIVRRPAVFLLDEPLSGVDAQQKANMRSEIAKLNKATGITFVYVTHDQTEAMSMGDRIVIMREGEIVQTDVPSILYDYPSTVFAATFIGTPQMNILSGKLTADGIELDGKIFALPEKLRTEVFDGCKADESKEILIGVRPENVVLGGDFNGTVLSFERLGSETIVYITSALKNVIVLKCPHDMPVYAGMDISFGFDLERAILFDSLTNSAISGLPDYNILPADFDAELLAGLLSKNVTEDAPAYIGVPPQNICMGGDVPAKLCRIDNYGDTQVCRFKVDGIDGYLTARLKNSGLKAGDRAMLKISQGGLILLNSDRTRISADYLTDGELVRINLPRGKDKAMQSGTVEDIESVGDVTVILIRTRTGNVRAVTSDDCSHLRIRAKLNFVQNK